MALVAMAVYDTEENKRTEMTRRTLYSLSHTVDWSKHRLIISDNNSCEATKELYKEIERIKLFPVTPIIIYNETNLGTAEAINKAWRFRTKDESAIKMDNDVVIHQKDWIEDMELTIKRNPGVGIVGLKRKDCWENPDHPDNLYRSELLMTRHESGERWMVIEKVKHIIGTCTLYNPALLERIGYLCQPRLYGFDDSLASFRSRQAGFINVFLPHIEIDHIDDGTTPYQGWKEKHSESCWDDYHKAINEYTSGVRKLYYNPF
jgi:GT2 family glycosyltransferase